MTTEPYYKLPANTATDIDTYAADITRFQNGQIDAADLKGRRVPRGVYEQRRDGTFMVRTRIAGGALSVAQAAALAAASREFGNGMLHVTTRQDIQFHDVAIANTPTVMRRLLDVGLSSRGGGGNTVRNITTCQYAGTCPAELFDVSPCAMAVTEYMIAQPNSYNLPRKYKIAFSSCPADCSLAQVVDLGFIAAIRNDQPGFRVMVGGGMGAWSRLADTLLEWAPTTDIIRIAETVKRLFNEHGDRHNRHRARLRFVVEKMGMTEFTRLFAARYADVVADGVPEWHGTVIINNTPSATSTPPPLELRHGLQVVPQHQHNLYTVHLHTPLGFISANDLAALGALATTFSTEHALRATITQNLLMRSVKETDLPALADALTKLEADLISPQALQCFTACAGAATCRLGICLGRQAARACADLLDTSNLSPAAPPSLHFNINGCSNACGQQPIAAIGFFGIALRAHDQLLPAYTVTLGGRCDATGARLGENIGKLPAAAMPHFLCDLVADFNTNSTQGEKFPDYYDRQGKEYFQHLLQPHTYIPSPTNHPEYYRDFGSNEPFSLAGRGSGECATDLFKPKT